MGYQVAVFSALQSKAFTHESPSRRSAILWDRGHPRCAASSILVLVGHREVVRPVTHSKAKRSKPLALGFRITAWIRQLKKAANKARPFPDLKAKAYIGSRPDGPNGSGTNRCAFQPCCIHVGPCWASVLWALGNWPVGTVRVKTRLTPSSLSDVCQAGLQKHAILPGPACTVSARAGLKRGLAAA